MMIQSCEDLERTVQELGFLPFFKNDIEGFSIEEMTPDELWFSDELDGPWEWKGPVIREGNCAYGKLFRGKAGYVSMDWYPDFLNFRRAGYQPTEMEQKALRLLKERESLLSRELKKLCGYKRAVPRSRNPLDKLIKTPVIRNKNKEGFETVMTHLQMHALVVIADFEYQYTADGNRYGWGIARYTTPEALYEDDILCINTSSSPEDSLQRMLDHLSKILPQASETQILKLINP